MKQKGPERQPAVTNLSASGQRNADGETTDGFEPLLATFSRIFYRSQAWIAWILVAIPVLIACWYVATYGVNLAWEDQFFSITRLYEKWYGGSLHLGDFWEQHNEHRHFLPRLAMFAMGLVSSWNTKWEMWLGQILLATNLAIVSAALIRACRVPWRYWLLVPPAWIVFSLRQHQNFLCGFQLGFLMAATSAIGAFALLASMRDERRFRLKYFAALVVTTIGTLSSGHGLLLWPICLLPLSLALNTRQQRWRLISIWCAVWFVEWAIYFIGYHKTIHPIPIVQDRTLGNCSDYFITVIGAALFPLLPALAKMGGVMMLGIAALAVAAALRFRAVRDNTFWLAVLAFGLLTQAQVAWGRTPYGIGLAFSSRYATFSLFVVLGSYGILSTLFARQTGRLVSSTWGALLGLAAIGVGLSYIEGLEEGAALKQRMDYKTYLFLTADSQPDESLLFAPWDKAADDRKMLAVLKKFHLNIFAPSERPERFDLPPSTLPTIAGQPRFQMAYSYENHDLVLSGFALAPDGADLVGGIVFEIDGVPYRAYYGLTMDSAPDVQKNPQLRKCGFRREFSQQQLPAGIHRLAVKVLTKQGNAWYALGPPQPINVPVWPEWPK